MAVAMFFMQKAEGGAGWGCVENTKGLESHGWHPGHSPPWGILAAVSDSHQTRICVGAGITPTVPNKPDCPSCLMEE